MAKRVLKRAAIVAVELERKRKSDVIHATDWREDVTLCGLRNYAIAELLPRYTTCKRCLAVLEKQTWWKPKKTEANESDR